MITKSLLLFGAASLLAACSPNVATTSVAVGTPPLASAYPSETTAPADAANRIEPDDWWRRFRDPALSELVDLGLAQAPDLAVAAARIQQARAGLRAAAAERAPNVGAAASIELRRNSSEEFDFEVPAGSPGGFRPEVERYSDRYRAGLDARWDADLFGRLAASQRAAAARLDATTLDAQAVRLSLITDIARNFIAARAAAARLAVAEQTVKDARDLLEITGARRRGGLVTGIDVTRAESLVAETAAAIPPLDAERRARIAAIVTLTGADPARVATLVAADAKLPPLDMLPAPGVPSELLRRRPDIAAAERRLTAANTEIAAAAAQRYPNLTITAGLGLVAGAIDNLLTGGALTGSLVPRLSAPLLDFGRIDAFVDLRRGEEAEAVAAYKRTVLTAFGEVETSLATAEAQRNRVRELDRLVAANRATADIGDVQYRRGLADFLGVLDARRELNRSLDARVVAQAAALDAALLLFRSTGGDVPPVPLADSGSSR